MVPVEMLAGITQGSKLFEVIEHINRDTLVRYAGASGDFNAIHYNDTAALDAGLPNVIAHGMLTMGLAATAVENWAGDPTAIAAMGTRFASMVVVGYPDGTDVRIIGLLGQVAPGRARIELQVEDANHEHVLTHAFADVKVSG